MLKKWSMMNKFYNALKQIGNTEITQDYIKELVISTSFVKSMKQYYRQKSKQQNQLLSQLEEDLKQLKIDNLSLFQTNRQLEYENYILQQDKASFKQKLQFLDKSLLMNQNQKQIYENAYKSILKIINPKLETLQPQQINSIEMNDSKIDLFLKVQNMGKVETRTLKEVITQVEKSEIATKQIYEVKKKKNAFTITEIFGLKQNLQLEIKEEKENPRKNQIKQLETSSSNKSESDQEDYFEVYKKKKRINQAVQVNLPTFQSSKIPAEKKRLTTHRPSVVVNDLNQLFKREQNLQNQTVPISFQRNEDNKLKQKFQLKAINLNEQNESEKEDEEELNIQQNLNKSPINVDLNSTVFQRLYKEGHERIQRRGDLFKKGLTLEEKHWKEVLSLLNYLSCKNQIYHNILVGEQAEVNKKIKNSIKFYREQLYFWRIHHKNTNLKNQKRSQTQVNENVLQELGKTTREKPKVCISELVKKFENQTLNVRNLKQRNKNNLTFYDDNSLRLEEKHYHSENKKSPQMKLLTNVTLKQRLYENSKLEKLKKSPFKI